MFRWVGEIVTQYLTLRKAKQYAAGYDYAAHLFSKKRYNCIEELENRVHSAKVFSDYDDFDRGIEAFVSRAKEEREAMLERAKQDATAKQLSDEPYWEYVEADKIPDRLKEHLAYSDEQFKQEVLGDWSGDENEDHFQ